MKEILRFASVGTKMALQIRHVIEDGERPWSSDKEFANFILSQLAEELENYFGLSEAFHFLCNPLLLIDSYIWTLAYAETVKDALNFLYRKHSL